MVNFKYLVPFFLISISTISCTDLLDNEFSEREIEIFNECKANLILSESELEENIVGSWKLIAYACQTCQEDIKPNDAIYTFHMDKSGIIRINGSEHNIVWDIVELPTTDSSHKFKLEIIPSTSLKNAMFFCPNYILYESSEVRYIYKKDG